MSSHQVIIKPSLSINITDKCNLKCIYCPPHGENFIKCKRDCNIDSIVTLINTISKYNLPVVRLTGGEPLLFPEKVEAILVACINNSIPKIIINTNGTRINDNILWMKEYKESFLLKISLDTINNDLYDNITNSNNEYTNVINSIIQAKEKGFNIEINTVITRSNADGIMDVIDFADHNRIDIKLFGFNDFGGQADRRNYIPLNNIVDQLNNRFVKCKSERLPGDRGIKMQSFNNLHNNKILVVEHISDNKDYSYKRDYSDFCKKCCYFPCASGLFSITLRADGLLQSCRMRPEEGIAINNIDAQEMDVLVKKILKPYSNIFSL